MSDLIDRWMAIELIHSLYPSAPIMRINRKQWEKKYKPYIEAEKALEQLPSAQPEPCDDPRADIYYLAEKIGIHRLYALVVELRGEPEPCEDTISRQQAITALRALSDEDGYISAPHEVVTDVVRVLPPVKVKQGQTTQPEQGDSDKFGVKTSETCEDCISRQAAISAICNACGKIDCDKMDKCEKLQLPPANCSEFPNNSDTISRQAAIETLSEYGNGRTVYIGAEEAIRRIEQLPPAQPERKTGKWNFIGNQMFECSECGTCYTQSQFYQMRVRISDTEFPNFCPDCGADMREGQDG